MTLRFAHRDELLAALAAVLARYEDLDRVTLGHVGADGARRTVVLDLADRPGLAELTARAAAAETTDGDAETWQGCVSERALDDPSTRCVLVTPNGEGAVLAPGRAEDAAFVAHVATLVRSGRAAADAPVDRLAMVTPAELERVLVDWNRTAAEYPNDCLEALIDAQAQRTPQRIAVRCGEDSLTYAELTSRSNQLAHRLVALGVGPEVLVGICMTRSTDMLVGLLGILKAGGAYVPIDPTYPSERQTFMLASSQAPVVVTEAPLLDSLPLDGLEVVCLDRDWPAVAQEPATAPQLPSDPERLAYVIYTSGSTGQPKGVQIPHRALVNFLWTMRERPGLAPEDVLVAVTTLSFDIAGLELYLPLITGAQVVLAPAITASDPRALAELLERSQATIMQATPTTWRMLLDAGWAPPAGMRALCGGEPLPVALADRLVASGLELWNMYGPTETTIWSTCTRITTTGQTLTIGRPIANTALYILDEHQAPVPIGVPGELWIGGDGVARGYRGRDDLTQQRFLPDPFAPGGGRMYRTGDLVRYRPDGHVEFLGRLDHQVKVRGYRIELGEIETVLTRHPGIAEAVVVAREATGGEAELAAYVIAAAEPVPAHEVRTHAARSLPAYMVPLTVTTLQAFPLTPNGKVDRKALPEPTRERSGDRELIAPRTALERRLAEIWARELQISPIGVTDDFFNLGVTSIVAAQLFAAIEHELGSSLPLGAIFRAPTIEALAGLLEAPGQTSRWKSLVPIQPHGTQPPIFCIHGGAGTILHLAALARRLGPDQPFYGLQSRGLYGGASPLRTVEEMADFYLREMRDVHPGGPWRLAGYCFGTIVAFEIAQRLIAAGEDVELLAMFNGPSPAWIKKWVWYGNQPGWRARHGMAAAAPPPPRAARRRKRRIDKVTRAVKLVWRVPRLLGDPGKIANSVRWYTRGPRIGLAMALRRPINERDRERYFLDLHGRAERAYEPRPYPGEILVFYGQGLYDDPELGWTGLARQIQSFAVPGEHTNNRKAMREPAVGFVSDRLQEYLIARG